MKKAIVAITALVFTAGLGINSTFAGSIYEQAVDTAIDNKKAEKEGKYGQFPAKKQPQQERDKFKEDINQRIPIPTPKIDKEQR